MILHDAVKEGDTVRASYNSETRKIELHRIEPSAPTE